MRRARIADFMEDTDSVDDTENPAPVQSSSSSSSSSSARDGPTQASVIPSAADPSPASDVIYQEILTEVSRLAYGIGNQSQASSPAPKSMRSFVLLVLRELQDMQDPNDRIQLVRFLTELRHKVFELEFLS